MEIKIDCQIFGNHEVIHWILHHTLYLLSLLYLCSIQKNQTEACQVTHLDADQDQEAEELQYISHRGHHVQCPRAISPPTCPGGLISTGVRQHRSPTDWLRLNLRNLPPILLRNSGKKRLPPTTDGFLRWETTCYFPLPRPNLSLIRIKFLLISGYILHWWWWGIDIISPDWWGLMDYCCSSNKDSPIQFKGSLW